MYSFAMLLVRVAVLYLLVEGKGFTLIKTMTVPAPLQAGQTVRVIAPSRSINILSDEVRNLACDRLSGLGLNVQFGQHVEECGPQGVASVEQRLEDIHQAFADPDVHGILTVIGGFHTNQILRGLDFDLIRSHPKMFCGFSDITALSNAITQQAGLMTFYGPHFSSLGMQEGLEYTLESFRRMVMGSGEQTVHSARQWSDDTWFLDQESREFVDNPGWMAISSGEAEGRIVGGNNSTLGLLRGTPCMPDLQDSILFLEDSDLAGSATLDEFTRQLEALTYQPGFKGVKGLVIGRFQKSSQVTEQALRDALSGCHALEGMPILANVDFGHTTPIITIPLGGQARLKVDTAAGNNELVISKQRSNQLR